MGSLGVAGAADLPEGNLTLVHIVELVLIVAVTTNFMQYSWNRCSGRSSSSSHVVRFAPFYASLIATLLLSFPKADVVVGDVDPSTRGFTYQPGPKQASAVAGTISLLASVALLLWKPAHEHKDSKVAALLA